MTKSRSDQPVEAAKPAAKAEAQTSADTSANPFLLEDIFPDPVDLLVPAMVSAVAESDVIVAIDTNALLLPYAIGKDDLGALAKAYKKLAEEQRLFLPARSAREFIRHRDRKIADLLKTISDQSSKISVEGVLSPILEGLDGHDDLKKAQNDLNEGRKAYLKALAKIRTGIGAWRGNDPVTTLYAEVFTKANVIEHEGERAEIEKEWARRVSNKIPPGYKDGAKADGGIGDFLIWKVLLQLGRDQKKDLVFVTGEEKADWFVRTAGEPVFVRPELLVEYRAASDGKNLQLSSLADLLAQFGTEDSIVKEVRSAEASANSVVRTSRARIVRSRDRGTSGSVSFDYSTDNGQFQLPSPQGSFELRFSKAGDTRIHLYRTPSLIAIMRLKGVGRDEYLNIDEFDASSQFYTVGTGEAFAALNTYGEVLIGRILAITDDSRGPPTDSVTFEYRIFQSGAPLTAP